MANNIVNKYAPIITEKLDYSSIEMYLLKYGVITNQECTSHQKIIQNGTLTNGDLVRTKLMEKIFQKPREFYRALREHVNGKTEDVDPGNKELLRSLPESFGKKGLYERTFGRLYSSKSKREVFSTIDEDISSSDTDRNFKHINLEENHTFTTSDTEEEYENRFSASIPGGYSGRIPMSPSTQSMNLPIRKPKRNLRRQSSNDSDSIKISIERIPSVTSLPNNFEGMEMHNDIDHQFFQRKYHQQLEESNLELKERNQSMEKEIESLKVKNMQIEKEKEICNVKLQQATEKVKNLQTKMEEEKNTANSSKVESQKLNESLKAEVGKSSSLAVQIEKISKEKEIYCIKLEQATEKVTILENQLKEAKKAQEKELGNIRLKLDEEKSTAMKKVSIFENQLKETKIAQEKELSDIRTQMEEEKSTAIKKVCILETQLKETKMVQEKELSDIKAKMEKEKCTFNSNKIELQKLLEERELNLQTAKKHNQILLAENSRIHSAMEELPDRREEVGKLRKDIQKLKCWVKQNSQEFTCIKEFTDMVKETILIKNKACIDCSSVMYECDELSKKVNALLLENRHLKSN